MENNINIQKTMTELQNLRSEALSGPWNVDVCNVGSSCWCRTIGNKKGDDSLKHCLVPSGSISKQDAAFIVGVENKFDILASFVRDTINLLAKIPQDSNGHTIEFLTKWLGK